MSKLRWKNGDVLECITLGGARYVMTVLGNWRGAYVIGVSTPKDYSELLPDFLFDIYRYTNWRGHLALLRDASNVHRLGEFEETVCGTHYIIRHGGESHRH